MDPTDPDLRRATDVIECDHPRIQRLVRHLTAGAPDAPATAIRLFEHVRDQIRYFPFSQFDRRDAYRATATLDRGLGYCVQKAIVLVTLARAAGLPAALTCVNIRNQLAAPHLVEMMGSDLFAFHAYATVWLEDRWIKLTPAFDRDLSARHGFPLVVFDGHADALFAPTDAQGRPFVSYVREHGDFADLDLTRLLAAWEEVYGAERLDGWRAMLADASEDDLRAMLPEETAPTDAWAGVAEDSPS